MTRSIRNCVVAFVLLGTLPIAAVEEKVPGRVASLNGIELYYETHGSGETLLLLHGFGSSGSAWKPHIAELARHYRVIVPDLRGHGRSSNPSGLFTHRQSALDVLALADMLGLGRVRGMGISTGGMTLLHMATQQPDRIEAMVLIGATSYFPEEARAIMRRTTVESMAPQHLERQRAIHVRGDEQIRALRRQFHGFKDSYDDMNFTAPYLSTIKARTLVLHGDRDEFFPVAIPTEMYRSIPRSYLWIVPNGGHVPLGRLGATFVPATLEFLSGAWEPKAAAAEAGFTPLFNGRDLTGWSGDPRLWRVVDGAIVGSTDEVQIPHNSFLSTERRFSDFVLRLEVKLRNHNSGVQFRSEQFPDYVVRGYQADIAKQKYFGMLYEEGKRGFLEYWKKMTPEEQGAVFRNARVDDWNAFEITCRGEAIKLVLNGATVCDIRDPAGAREGVVALQLHRGDPMQVSFRSIRIRVLK